MDTMSYIYVEDFFLLDKQKVNRVQFQDNQKKCFTRQVEGQVSTLMRYKYKNEMKTLKIKKRATFGRNTAHSKRRVPMSLKLGM